MSEDKFATSLPASSIPPVEAIDQFIPDLVKKKAIQLSNFDRNGKQDTGSMEHGKQSKMKLKHKDRDASPPSLSAAEKFDMFKKQRETKGDGAVVDDLFKDFIAKKVNTTDEMNKLLDMELSQMNKPVVYPSANSVTVKTEPPDMFPPPPPPPVYGPQLPDNGQMFDSDFKELKTLVKDQVADGGDVSKKPLFGFKHFGIKLSVTSTELIQSGEVYKKGKRVEEGEVTSSDDPDSGGSDSSDSGEIDDDNDVSETGELSDGDDKSRGKKRKKKKKLKHKKKKKHKEKDKEKGSVKPVKEEEGALVVGAEKAGSKRKVSVTPKSRSRSPKKTKKSRSRSRDRDRRKRRSGSRSRRSRSRGRRSRSRGRRSRSKGRRSRSRGRRSTSRSRKKSPKQARSRRSRSRKRSRSRGRRSSSRNRQRRSRSRGRGRRSKSPSQRRKSKSPDPFWRSKYGDFDAYKFLSRKERREARSKSPERESEKFIEKEKKRMSDLRSKIDKAKLREIAIKNAISNAKAGGVAVNVNITAGGKSVEELTDFCKKISSKDKSKLSRHVFEDSSSDEETQKPVGSDDEDNLIHHPFKVKEAPIVMDIRNAKQISILSPQERIAQSTTLRTQFPVSSGSQHRTKEGDWVPVQKSEAGTTGTATKPATAKSGSAATSGTSSPATALAGIAYSTEPVKPVKPEDRVFEEPSDEPVDITSIISERLAAVRKLAENPQDIVAKNALSVAQKQASQWAQSKHLPGQFTGSTGASIMSHDELIGPNKKRQAWIKKDVFTNAAPLRGGIGMYLLEKMGWKQGTGLGKNNEGKLEPLMLDFKIDRKGLVTDGEGKKGGGGGGGQVRRGPVVKDLSGKHPVSALMELCNKRKWGAPQFHVIHESGQSHNKNFCFKVLVNGTEYQPAVASNNKKLAKAESATFCLQELGLVPR